MYNLGRTKIIMRRGPLTGTLSFLSYLSHLSSASSVFKITLFFLSILLKRSNDFGFVFADCLDQIPDTCQFFFSLFSNSHISSNFPSVVKTFILFITVALLSFLSAVNCRSRNVEDKFMHKVNYGWDLHSSGLLCSVDW